MLLNFNVSKQLIRRTDCERPVAKSVNYLYAAFSFSEEWQGTKTAVFSGSGVVLNQVLDSENKCLVPWEVIEAPGFSVSCFCGSRITANKVFVNVRPTGYAEGDTPEDPTPDVYEQIISLVDEIKSIAQSVRDDADSGAFDGEDGADGQDGATGADGKSAYQVAVDNGYEGTEQQWLASLKGEDGEPGTTDYTDLTNKPSVNGTVLSGNKTAAALGLQSKNLYFSNVAIAAAEWQGNTFAIETFTGDGTATAFTLQGTVASGSPEVKVSGVSTTAFTYSDGIITFTSTPADEAEIEVKYNVTADTGYADYDYKAVIACSGVTAAMPVDVYYDRTQLTSGNFSTPESGAGTVTIYSKVNSAITIPLIRAEVTA